MRSHFRSALVVTIVALSLVLFGTRASVAVPPVPNFDEAKVPAYTLPDPMTLANGQKVTDAETWRTRRRPELLALFKEHVYGTMPPPLPIAAVERPAAWTLFDGKATAQEVTLYLREDRSGPAITVLVVRPTSASAASPVPAFLACNFWGNHTLLPDGHIRIPTVWDRKPAGGHIEQCPATRGSWAHRWPVEMIVDRGYALATVYYGDIDPDFNDGYKNGVHAFYPELQDRAENWASIGAWAWGLSRILDFLEKEPAIDAKHVAVMGHSRLGKTALWAGANDERFAMVVSNNSGQGGASLARRPFGETLAHSMASCPYWYCKNYKAYVDHEDRLPVDQHELVALVAPRPVYVASADCDLWADPRGEFLACVGADPVYRLLTGDGLPSLTWPSPEQPLHGRIGYHVRTGRHGVTDYDWKQFLDFADKHLRPAP